MVASRGTEVLHPSVWVSQAYLSPIDEGTLGVDVMVEALLRYPLALRRQLLSTLYVGSSVYVDGEHVNGAADCEVGAMALQHGTGSSKRDYRGVARTTHHEFAHLIACRELGRSYVYSCDRTWSYLKGAEETQLTSDVGLLERGFLSEYSSTCAGEDMAVFASFLMTEPCAVAAYATLYPAVSERMHELVGLYSGLGIAMPATDPEACAPADP